MFNTKEDMRGLFSIVKGQYKKDNAPDGVCVSGYDPVSPNTVEWYQVMDNVVYHTFYAGTSYEKAKRAIVTCILKRKTREEYFKHVCTYTSEDYYEVHYLGQPPLTDKQHTEKCEGRCPRVSPTTKALNQKVIMMYGDFFSDDIAELEDEAYKQLKDSSPLARNKKLLSRRKSLTPSGIFQNIDVEIETPDETPQEVEVKSLTPLNRKRPVSKLKSLARKDLE